MLLALDVVEIEAALKRGQDATAECQYDYGSKVMQKAPRE